MHVRLKNTNSSSHKISVHGEDFGTFYCEIPLEFIDFRADCYRNTEFHEILQNQLKISDMNYGNFKIVKITCKI